MKMTKTLKGFGLALGITLGLIVIAILINLIPLFFGYFYGGLIHLAIFASGLTILVKCILND